MSKSYGGSYIVMLVASGTVCENVRQYLETFTNERDEITAEYIDSFEDTINNALQKYLGVNSHTQVKEATQVIRNIAKASINDLGLFSVQFLSDFKKERDRKNLIYSTLGFTKSWRKAQTKNNTALIELLLTFQNNLTPEIESEITAKGLRLARINSVLAHADTLRQANITQESLKGIAKVQTAQAKAVFDNIYEESIKLCTLGRQLFRTEKARRAMFSFRALERAQIAAGVGSNDSKPKAKSKSKKAKAEIPAAG